MSFSRTTPTHQEFPIDEFAGINEVFFTTQSIPKNGVFSNKNFIASIQKFTPKEGQTGLPFQKEGQKWFSGNNCRMVGIPKFLVYDTKHAGFGLITLSNIKKGHRVLAYSGDFIDLKDAKTEDDTLAGFEGNNAVISCRKSGSLAHLINHVPSSLDRVMITLGGGVIIMRGFDKTKIATANLKWRFSPLIGTCLTASRDINAGEVLLYDYGKQYTLINFKDNMRFFYKTGEVLPSHFCYLEEKEPVKKPHPLLQQQTFFAKTLNRRELQEAGDAAIAWELQKQELLPW